jgi:ABC-type phosphate transport system substrate-binding protein
MSDEVHALQVTGENTDQAALPGQARTHELCLAAPSEPRDEVRTFIQWTLGSEAQQIVMEHLASPR